MIFATVDEEAKIDILSGWKTHIKDQGVGQGQSIPWRLDH